MVKCKFGKKAVFIIKLCDTNKKRGAKIMQISCGSHGHVSCCSGVICWFGRRAVGLQNSFITRQNNFLSEEVWGANVKLE